MRLLGREIRTFVFPDHPRVPPWGSSSSAVEVDRTSVLGIAAVWACVRLLTSSVSRLPVDTLIKRDGVPVPYQEPRWLRTPILSNPNVGWIEHCAGVVHSLLADGNFFTLTVRDDSNDVSEIYNLDPQRVEITGSVAAPGYKVRTGGKVAEYGPDEVLHRPLLTMPGDQRGVSPLEAARMVYSVGLASQEYAGRFFEQDATPPGYLSVPAGTQVKADELKKGWVEAHAGPANWHQPGVLTGGIEYKSIAITHEQAQFLEQRQLSRAEIATLYGIPPDMIGDVERSTSWGSGIEVQGIRFVTYTLNDLLVLIEKAYGRLVPNPSSYLRFNRNALMRGDAESRAKFYGELWDRGVMNADDILASEDKPPLPGGAGKTYFVSTQVQSVEEARKPPAPIPAFTQGAPDAVGPQKGRPLPGQ